MGVRIDHVCMECGKEISDGANGITVHFDGNCDAQRVTELRHKAATTSDKSVKLQALNAVNNILRAAENEGRNIRL